MTNDKEAQSALNIYFPRLSGCTGERIASNAIISFAYSDAPTSLTASAQSVTFGWRLNIEDWRLVGYADIIFKSFIIYFSRLFGCTSFADSIHSVSDLRFNIYIFSSAQSVTFGSRVWSNFDCWAYFSQPIIKCILTIVFIHFMIGWVFSLSFILS